MGLLLLDDVSLLRDVDTVKEPIRQVVRSSDFDSENRLGESVEEDMQYTLSDILVLNKADTVNGSSGLRDLVDIATLQDQLVLLSF